MREKATEAAEHLIAPTQHMLFVWIEAFGFVIVLVTICLIVFRAYTNPEIPSVVANRILFGLLTFGLVVYLFKSFGDKLSADVFSFAIGSMVGAIITIITFLYDTDKEHKDHNNQGNTDITEYEQQG